MFNRVNDKAFDRITTLAAMLFDAPMAGICTPSGSPSQLGSAMPGALDKAAGDGLTCLHELPDEAPHARFFLAAPLVDADGERLGVLYVADTQPRHPTPSQLQALINLASLGVSELRQRRMAAIISGAPEMVLVIDAVAQRVTYLNEDASNYAIGQFPLTREAIHEGDMPAVMAAAATLTCLDARATVDLRVNPGERGWRWVRARLRVSRCDRSGAPLEVTAVCTDVTEAKELREQLVAARDQLAELVTTDELTQVANKRGLKQRLQQLSAEAERGRRFAVVMADIDHFKKLNDTHGHAAGDRVLHDFAQVLQACVRKTDFVARFGGEEFCVVLTDVDGPAALQLAERLRAAAAPLNITASFGVSLCSGPDRANAAALLEEADQALYRAKRAGRNRVAMARRTMPSGSKLVRAAA